MESVTGIQQTEGSITSSDSGGSGGSFIFPSVSSQSSFASFSGSIPLGYRRGPGRPRKDGNVPFQRMSGRGNLGRVRIKSQLIGGFQRFSGSSSSPSTSSPDTPAAWEPGDSPYPPVDAPLVNISSDAGPRCAFCNLPGNSLLGQGDLISHPKSSEFSLDSVILKRELEHERIEQVQLRYPHLAHHPRSKQELAALYQKCEIFSEIEVIGLPDDVQLDDLLTESSGECLAHFCCGAWSDGVIQSEDYSLINVDKAIISGLQQRCSGCGSYGATISCRHKTCQKKYHYPCASGFGGFLDIKSLIFLCSDHVSKAPEIVGKEAECAKCKKTGRVEEELFCTSCGQHFHASCLDPPVKACLQTRAGWLCNECKICQYCRSAGDDDRMLVCESCDKGYHTYCMQPVLSSVPKHTWKCKFCRVCKDCGSRRPGSGTSSRWHLNYSICDSCYQQRNKGLICPVCNRAYRHQRDKSMVQCSSCNKHIHYECDPEGVSEEIEQPNYICPICKRNPAGFAGVFCGRESASVSASASPSVSTVDDQEDDQAEEAEILAAFMKNEMGTDSLSGTGSPFSELGTEFGEVDFDTLTTPEDSNLSGIQSGSDSGWQDRTGFPFSSRKFGSGKCLSRKKQSQYRRSRSTGKRPEAFKARLPGATSGTGRRRGRPSKYSTTFSVGISSFGEESNNGNEGKEKDDEEYIHTVVVTHSKDQFVLCQDICVICGSLGKGEEGRLISCTQCGQCYHFYCANVKMNVVVLRRGWRCLDCTVCEGCGQGEDEPHLLLCDECDVSFHTYCLDPPLEQIPLGAWRCQWCAKCQRCGNAFGAAHSYVANNFCPSCDSLCRCCRCNIAYKDGEQIIVCQNCGRWCHGKCEGLLNEELLETASERGFRCAFCRPPGSHCLSVTFFGTTDVDETSSVDGVILTKQAAEVTSWRVGSESQTPVPNVGAVQRHLNDSRNRPGVLGGAARAIEDTIDEVTAAVTKTFTGQSVDEYSTELERAESVEDVSTYDILSPVGSGPLDFQPKRRGRKVPKPGVGGFVVRPVRQRSTTVEDLIEGQDPSMTVSEEAGGGGGVWLETGGMISPAMDAAGGQVKQRRKRKPRRGILEDSYPSIIQDSFFANGCLSDTLHQPTRQLLSASPVLDEQRHAFHLPQESRDCELSHLSADQLRKQETGAANNDSEQLSLDELDDDLFRTITEDQELLDSESLFKMLENMGGVTGSQDSRGQSPIAQQDMDRPPFVTELGDVDGIMNELNPSLDTDDARHVSGGENLVPSTYVNQQQVAGSREIKLEQPTTPHPQPQTLDQPSGICRPINPVSMASLHSSQQTVVNPVPMAFMPQEPRPVGPQIVPPPAFPHQGSLINYVTPVVKYEDHQISEPNNPFKVPQRPEGHQQEQQGVPPPPRPSSLMIRTPEVSVVTGEPIVRPQQHRLLLDELMDAEIRERDLAPGSQHPHFPHPMAIQSRHGFPPPPRQGWPPPSQFPRFPAHPRGQQPFVRSPVTMMPPMFKDQQHEAMFRKQEELTAVQKGAEEELGRLRKIKKNITAKQRQLKKNDQGSIFKLRDSDTALKSDGHPQELSDEEKMQLESVTREIQEKQKRFEQAKKHVKQHGGQLHDFEVKNGIVQETPSPHQPPRPQVPPPPVPVSGEQSQLSPMFHPAAQSPLMLIRGQAPGQSSNVRLGGPPPPQNFPTPTHSGGLTSPYTVLQGDTNPFSEGFEERERIERQKQVGVPQFAPTRPTPYNQQDSEQIPPDQGGNDKKKQYKRRRKKKGIIHKLRDVCSQVSGHVRGRRPEIARIAKTMARLLGLCANCLHA